MLRYENVTIWPAGRSRARSLSDQAAASMPDGDPGFEDLLGDHPAIGRGTNERELVRSGRAARDPLAGRGAGRVILF